MRMVVYLRRQEYGYPLKLKWGGGGDGLRMIFETGDRDGDRGLHTRPPLVIPLPILIYYLIEKMESLKRKNDIVRNVKK